LRCRLRAQGRQLRLDVPRAAARLLGRGLHLRRADAPRQVGGREGGAGPGDDLHPRQPRPGAGRRHRARRAPVARLPGGSGHRLRRVLRAAGPGALRGRGRRALRRGGPRRRRGLVAAPPGGPARAVRGAHRLRHPVRGGRLRDHPLPHRRGRRARRPGRGGRRLAPAQTVEGAPRGVDVSDAAAAPAPGADPAGPETAAARPSPWRVDRALLLIVAGLTVLGLGIRWYNILEVRPICDPPRSRDVPTCFDLYAGTNDPLYGHLQARLIADGHWFVNPFTAISQPEDVPFPERALPPEPSGPFVDSVGDPPVYQLFLAAASALGFESGQSPRLLSALVGVSVVPLTALLALRLARRRAAIAAAAIAAVHPLLWINDGMLLSEAVYAPLVALALVLTYWFRDGPSPRRAAALGFVVMLAAHTRAEAMVLVPMLVLPAVLGLRRRSWRQRGALLGASAATTAARLAPRAA